MWPSHERTGTQGLRPSFGLQTNFEVEALWSCSDFIFSWNWWGNRCLSVGIPSRKVRFPRSVRKSKKRRCRQTFKRALALPSMTRASSSISWTVSGSVPPSHFSLGGESRSIKTARMGLATVRKGPCCPARPSSKWRPPWFSGGHGIFLFHPSCLPPLWELAWNCLSP